MKQKNNTPELVTKSFLEDKLRLLDENAIKYKDEVLTRLDDISGQLENLTQENLIGTHQTAQLSDKFEDHEKRLTLLESAK